MAEAFLMRNGGPRPEKYPTLRGAEGILGEHATLTVRRLEVLGDTPKGFDTLDRKPPQAKRSPLESRTGRRPTGLAGRAAVGAEQLHRRKPARPRSGRKDGGKWCPNGEENRAPNGEQWKEPGQRTER